MLHVSTVESFHSHASAGAYQAQNVGDVFVQEVQTYTITRLACNSNRRATSSISCRLLL